MFLLQVGLSVKILRLDVGDALRQRAFNHDHIAGEKLVLLHLHYAANLDIQALCLDEVLAATRSAHRQRIVLLVVLLASLIILKRILDH